MKQGFKLLMVGVFRCRIETFLPFFVLTSSLVLIRVYFDHPYSQRLLIFLQLDLMSTSNRKKCMVNHTIIYECAFVLIETDMDAHIGDLHSLIVDREIEIIQALLEEVLVYDTQISYACDVCAELDCLLAFADVSTAYDYRRPVMVEDNIIDIVQGRYIYSSYTASGIMNQNT